MKRARLGLCILLIICCIAPVYPTDPLTQYQEDTDRLYVDPTGCAANDGQHTAISASMVGWGLALAAGIALLAGLLHQSKSGHAHD